MLSPGGRIVVLDHEACGELGPGSLTGGNQQLHLSANQRASVACRDAPRRGALMYRERKDRLMSKMTRGHDIRSSSADARPGRSCGQTHACTVPHVKL